MDSDSPALRLGVSERIWRQLLLDPNARGQLVVNLSKRPLEVAIVRRRPLERVRIFALVALLILASSLMSCALFDGNLNMGLITGVLFLLIGFTALVVVAASRVEWHASWQSDSVQVRDRRWGTLREWSAGYHEFEGVAVRRLAIAKPTLIGERRARIYHLVELRHPDPLKTVLIASVLFDPDRAEHAAAEAARSLGLARV